MTLGEKIRNAREDLDMKQSDVAKLIFTSQSNYSKIERNVQEPSIEQLKKICQILKLDPRYLLDLEAPEDLEMISPEDKKLLKDIKEFITNHKI